MADGGQARVDRHQALGALEARLVAAPDSVDLRYRRAGLLAALGRGDEARAEYIVVLAGAPTHFAALNDLGTLLHATGYRTAARTAYGEAVARHPAAPTARVNLANLLLEDGDVEAARTHYHAALAAAPDHPEAHQGLARIHDELGNDRAADHHRRLGFRDRSVRELPYHGAGPGVPLVILIAAAGGNVPTRPLIDDRDYRCTVVVADFFAGAALPPHRAVFNAVGDADLCRAALDAAVSLTARTNAPVINRPDCVLKTGRVENARRLASIPGVRAPRTAMVARHALATAAGPSWLAAEGFRFPLLLRRPGFHTGRHFLRLDAPAQLGAALAALPGEQLAAIDYLDARGGDGMARKYRAMVVDGALYPLHLAIAANWKVHYFTAAMADHPDHRAEEAAFLADMPGVIGPRAMRALEGVRDALGLDYGGIDFGLDAAGNLLLFEANATMVVNPPEPDSRWDYRRAPVERVLAAVRFMLAARVAG